jgi:hypothetical protein
MRHLAILLGLITFLVLLPKCENERSKCSEVTLFYTPKCSSIKGHVIFTETGDTKVFMNELPTNFQVHDTIVCIKYENLGNYILMADCTMGPIIKIIEINGEPI